MAEEIEDDGFITVYPDLNKKVYDERHGGPYDRGSADSYYGRIPKPHYYVEGTGSSPMVEQAEMTSAEIEAYYAGYEDNEREGNRKY